MLSRLFISSPGAVSRALDACFGSAEALSGQATSNLRTLVTHAGWAAFSPQSTLRSRLPNVRLHTAQYTDEVRIWSSAPLSSDRVHASERSTRPRPVDPFCRAIGHSFPGSRSLFCSPINTVRDRRSPINNVRSKDQVASLELLSGSRPRRAGIYLNLERSVQAWLRFVRINACRSTSSTFSTSTTSGS